MSATITYTVTTNDDVFQLDVDGEMVDYQRAVLDYGDDIVVTYPASDSIDDLAAALREAGYTPVDAGCERVTKTFDGDVWAEVGNWDGCWMVAAMEGDASEGRADGIATADLDYDSDEDEDGVLWEQVDAALTKMGLYEVPGYRPGTPYGYVIAVAN